MTTFLQRHQSSIKGVLHGFDRILFRGTMRLLASASGMASFLAHEGVLFKDFGRWSSMITQKVRESCEGVAKAAGRPIEHVNSSRIAKEEVARRIAARDGIQEGLICVITSIDPALCFDIRHNKQTKRLELVVRERKCLWDYHYWLDPYWGFMHARIQTWLPLTVKVYVNGREWLARQMERNGLGYIRRDNCFIDLEDVRRSQRLLSGQLRVAWPTYLNRVLKTIHPGHQQLFKSLVGHYYWSADETEWATDIMFKERRVLAELYPHLLRHGMSTLGSWEVMRFLGKAVGEQGRVHGRFSGEVVSDLRKRTEGIRIKHRVNGNWIKMYDKQGSVLRVETVINQTREFKVYRAPENRPRARPSWQKMRKGVADLARRAKISQGANERYLDAMAAVEHSEQLENWLQPLCQSVSYGGRRVRALNPWSPTDAMLLEVIGRGEFLLNGFRNRDIRLALYPNTAGADPLYTKRMAARITRMIRLLRAHRLVNKVAGTHRYRLSSRGANVLAALSAANASNIKELLKIAA